MLALGLPRGRTHELPTSPQGLPTVVIHLVAATTVADETAVIIGRLVPGEATLLLVGFLAYAGRPRIVPALRVIPAVVTGDTPGRPLPRLRAVPLSELPGGRPSTARHDRT
ncbi:hypothetical protein [Micromonospora sp. KC723]|uniref:hypothetical protein n=1 Tax=Micromonospora sp. KC723 TaxID=2530381 RepID=UPI00104DC877|nr:hypothetical protein [Micromonospora sp. KC723]TDB71399.1 hypothetical protein E1165_23100 [Micromonospora sp. KC723]